jgi:hypothetical protein
VAEDSSAVSGSEDIPDGKPDMRFERIGGRFDTKSKKLIERHVSGGTFGDRSPPRDVISDREFPIIPSWSNPIGLLAASCLANVLFPLQNPHPLEQSQAS